MEQQIPGNVTEYLPPPTAGSATTTESYAGIMEPLAIPWVYQLKKPIVNYATASPIEIMAAMERAQWYAEFLHATREIPQLKPCWPRHPYSFMVLHDLYLAHLDIYEGKNAAGANLNRLIDAFIKARNEWAEDMKKCDMTYHAPRIRTDNAALRQQYYLPGTHVSYRCLSPWLTECDEEQDIIANPITGELL